VQFKNAGGMAKFAWQYQREFPKNYKTMSFMDAYRNIPFEQDAYDYARLKVMPNILANNNGKSPCSE
jgi:hypothetical protein